MVNNGILTIKQGAVTMGTFSANQSGDTLVQFDEPFSGSYTDLTNKPNLFSGNYDDLSGKPILFSGSYNDLTDKPTIPRVQVVADEATYNAMTKDANTLYLIPAAV
jgi:hypothetical protein